MSGKYSTHHVFELFPNSAIMGTVEEGTLPYNLWQGESSSSSSSSNPSDAVLFGGICLLVGVSCRTLLRRTTIPYTVVLLILGIALGSLGSYFPSL